MGDFWHSNDKSLSVCVLYEHKPWDVHYCTVPPSQSLLLHSVTLMSVLLSLAMQQLLSCVTVLSAALHAENSKMTCFPGSLQHLHLSLGKFWGIVWRFASLFFSDSCISSDLGFSEAKWLRWEVSYWSRIVCLFKCDSLGDCMMIWLGWKHFLWYSLLFYIYINIFYGKCPGRILLWHIRFPVSPFLCIWD